LPGRSFTDTYRAGRAAAESDLNVAFDLLHVVHVVCFDRWSVDYGSRSDVEPGAVTLAHHHGSRQQSSGKRARLFRASTEVVEGVEAFVNTRDRIVIEVLGSVY